MCAGEDGRRAVGAARVLALMLMLAAIARAEPTWSELHGGDHGGADWEPADGATVGGLHVNVGAFRVREGRSVSVAAYEGGRFGRLEVHARTIEVAGALSADGAGYRGGRAGGVPGEGPGGGGAGATPGDVVGGSGAGGGHGGAGGLGFTLGAVCTERRPGAGDGAGFPGTASGDDDPTRATLGSGGGAAGNSQGCANLRGPGGRGGGGILLVAAGDVRVTGRIAANGEDAPRGDGRCGYRGGGGGGAGGSVLLHGARVIVEGAVRAAGGAGGNGDGQPLTHGCNGFGGGGGGGGRVLAVCREGEPPGRLGAPGGDGGRGTGCGGGHGLAGEPGIVRAIRGAPLAARERMPEGIVPDAAGPAGAADPTRAGIPAADTAFATGDPGAADAAGEDDDAPPPAVPAITADALRQRLDRGDDLLVVFVGFRSVYEQARIPGARIAEWSEFDAYFAQVDRDREIVLYCDCCSAQGAGVSGMFVHRLLVRGFRRVAHLEGHFAAWRARGMPVESDR